MTFKTWIIMDGTPDRLHPQVPDLLSQMPFEDGARVNVKGYFPWSLDGYVFSWSNRITTSAMACSFVDFRNQEQYSQGIGVLVQTPAETENHSVRRKERKGTDMNK
ncbi:hypothetical protein [Faecalibaculum rodentium]|uniref:hypothetical protein n=1 Tax=Faecalibaculum rodentium TaxID=1702221 RepID=UPI003F66E61C